MTPESPRTTVEVLDTPRDQDQSPQINLTAEQKIALARINDAFGIDYTEAGFPESNSADRAVFRYFQEHPDELQHTKLAAFGATRRAKLGAEQDPGLRSLLNSGAPALVVVGKSSRQQAEAVLQVNGTQNLAMIRDTFTYLRAMGVDDLTFDAEHYFDGYKLDQEYSLEALRAAIDAGVQRVVLCDTKGGSFPHEVADITGDTIAALRALNPNLVFGVHMHDDADMATANTVAGIDAGARHYQGTWLGYGERVANGDHTKILPNLHRRGYATAADLPHLKPTAEQVADLLQVQIEPHASFVGRDAFAHKAGQHTSGNNRDPMANQFMTAETVGNQSRSILSKQAGRQNILDFLRRVHVLDDRTATALQTPESIRRMLELLDEYESRGVLFRDAEASFLLLALRDMNLFSPRFQIHGYSFEDSSETGASATLQMQINGDTDTQVHTGKSRHGTVDALKSAFISALGKRAPVTNDLRLKRYHVNDLPSDKGTASEVQVIVEFTDGDEQFYTTGVAEDMLAASGHAMSDAVHYVILKAEMQGSDPILHTE